MRVSSKVVIAVMAVFALACLGIWVQHSESSLKPVKLTKQDMELLVSEVLPPGQQQQLAANPEEKKRFAARLKELLAVGQYAEKEGYAERPAVRSQISLQNDLALRDIYQKRNPGTTATDEEVNAYYQQHPADFTDFLEANPQFKPQAQGPQGEGLKKEFGQIRVVAQKARNQGVHQEDGARLRFLLERNQVLARAFISDLQQNADKLVTDADLDQYYMEHPEDFEEVRARHILIRSEPDEHSADDGHGHGEEDLANQPKGMTPEEARRKAESLLSRIRGGEDFSRLATENSQDPGSTASGGDLGFFGKGVMDPKFEETAFALKPGEVSNVIETQFGFHIIKLEERRKQPLDTPEARQQVIDRLKQKKLTERVDEITRRSDVEVAEDFEIRPDSPQLEPQLQGIAINTRTSFES